MNSNNHRTFLLVGHGSREESGNLEIEAFADKWRGMHPKRRIEVCFIEFAEVLIDEGLDKAARHGGQVIVLPLILNAAGHVKMEIPEKIEQARLRHPKVEFIYGKHLGASDGILSILKRNLRETMMIMDMPDPCNTGVILLGRGSSDRIANGEVAKIARWLYESADHPLVDIAFTGITHPRLESVVQRQVKLDMRQIAVLPYYLFSGILIDRIHRQVERLRAQYPTVEFAQADYMGFEDEIFELLEQRIAEATRQQAPMMMECDGCKYREFAADHFHHDH